MKKFEIKPVSLVDAQQKLKELNNKKLDFFNFSRRKIKEARQHKDQVAEYKKYIAEKNQALYQIG